MEYKDLYSDEGIFGNIAYSPPSVSRGLMLSMALISGEFFENESISKVLVVGAGAGYEVVNYLHYGYDVKAIDLFCPPVKKVQEVTHVGSAEDMPFDDDEFDMVHCTEMIEHIPEDITNNVLNECKRVAKRFLFTIATRHDRPYNTHINIHDWNYWRRKFKFIGFDIISAQDKPKLIFPVKNHIMIISWPDGTLLYGYC